MEYYVIERIARSVSDKDVVVAIVEKEEIAKHFCKALRHKDGSLYRYKKVSMED
jgi:hypothetical protein